MYTACVAGPQFLENSGGAKEDRTPDLFAASEALSQLSYSPKQQACMILVTELFVHIKYEKYLIFSFLKQKKLIHI